jgi:hypothetical protein
MLAGRSYTEHYLEEPDFGGNSDSQDKCTLYEWALHFARGGFLSF